MADALPTIVLTSPMRPASHEAASAEKPANTFAAKKMRAKRLRVDTPPEIEPIGGKALDDEAAAKRVEREQARTVAGRRRASGEDRRIAPLAMRAARIERSGALPTAADARENSRPAIRRPGPRT